MVVDAQGVLENALKKPHGGRYNLFAAERTSAALGLPLVVWHVTAHPAQGYN